MGGEERRKVRFFHRTSGKTDLSINRIIAIYKPPLKTPGFIQQLTELAPELSVSKALDKGDFLVREGDIETHLYYIEEGAVRAFLLTEFEDLTVRFGYRGSFINSLSSFIKGTPSEFYIEVLRKTKMRLIPKPVVMNLAHGSPENLREYTAMIEGVICQQIEREIDLLTPSPAERLRRVLERSPTLFQEIPLKYIASYLRMTPETLSRIRNS
jgi:CRP-like cAMP-binding protein